MNIYAVKYNDLLSMTPCGNYSIGYGLDEESEEAYAAFEESGPLYWGNYLAYSNQSEHQCLHIFGKHPITINDVYIIQDKNFEHNYVNKLQKGQIHIFVLTTYQIPGFEARFKRYNLDKYIQYRSRMGYNHNYLSRKNVNCLQVIVVNYKDYVK